MSKNVKSGKGRTSVIVGDRSLIWECDSPLPHVVQYLRSLNTGYFTYLLQIYSKDALLEGGNRHAEMSLRRLYMQVLETCMAIFCCMIQSPVGLPIWMLSYKTHELEKLVTSLSKSGKINGARKNFCISTYAEEILSGALSETRVELTVDEKSAASKMLAESLSRLMADFLTVDFHDEYNSIKHGHRALPGGIELRFRPEDDDSWLILRMPHGTKYPIREPRKGQGSVELKYHSVGYLPEQTVNRIDIAIGIIDLHIAFMLTNLTHQQIERAGFIPSQSKIDAAWERRDEMNLMNYTTDMLFEI